MDDSIAPSSQRLHRVNGPELRALRGKNVPDLQPDNLRYNCVLVREIVIKLRLLTPVSAMTSSRLVPSTPFLKTRLAAPSMMR